MCLYIAASVQIWQKGAGARPVADASSQVQSCYLGPASGSLGPRLHRGRQIAAEVIIHKKIA
jgi:hypothetical protein